MNFLANLPSTNFRVFGTMLCVWATTLRYLTRPPWEPSWEWLMFLAAMSGLDLAQFAFKRATHMEAPPMGPDVEDVQTPKEKPDADRPAG